MIAPAQTAGLALVALLAAAPTAAAQAPFEPGLRWVRPAPLADAWIPTSVGFAARDELCWSASRGTTPRVALDSTSARGLGEALFVDLADGQVAGAYEVVTTSARDGLFVVTQEHDGDPTQRTTYLSRYDPDHAALGADFAPSWATEVSIPSNGTVRLLVDEVGERGVFLMSDLQAGVFHLAGLDLLTGAFDSFAQYGGAAVDSATLSEDGSRLAVVSGSMLWVFDAALQVVDKQALLSATPAVAFDGDGSRLYVGSIAGLRVFEELNGQYQEQLVIAAAPGEIPKVLDASYDGRIVAVGWWNANTGVDARFEVLDAETGASLREVVQAGVPGGLQNSPSAVEVSRDGRRIACGSWGDGDADPELVLLDLDQDAPVLEANLPGSVLHLDLDASGTRVLVAAKHLHANQLGVTGELRLYDTGERDLDLLAAPRPGGVLHLAARAEGASAAWFLVGREKATPFDGGLALERSGLRVLAAPIAGEVAERSLSLPSGPRLVGLELTVQAAVRRPDGLSFSTTLVRPNFL